MNFTATLPLATHDRIIDLISWRLNVPSHMIYPYTRLSDDLHLDAFDRHMLIVEMESRLNIFLSPEEVEAIETVQDASFFFQKHVA